MLKSLNGYYTLVHMDNGMVISEWEEYPTSVKVVKWLCLFCLVGVILTFLGSFIPVFKAYGWEGVRYALTNGVNLIFVPISLVCVLGLALRDKKESFRKMATEIDDHDVQDGNCPWRHEKWGK